MSVVAAVVTQFMIVFTGTAVSAVVFFIAASVSTFAAVIAVFTFPVIITVSAAVIAIHTVFISRVHGKGQK